MYLKTFLVSFDILIIQIKNSNRELHVCIIYIGNVNISKIILQVNKKKNLSGEMEVNNILLLIFCKKKRNIMLKYIIILIVLLLFCTFFTKTFCGNIYPNGSINISFFKDVKGKKNLLKIKRN